MYNNITDNIKMIKIKVKQLMFNENTEINK